MTAPERTSADWEAFYQAYRKPGYVPGYEITSKLGGGMFGLVFKARKQSIGKDYAIKFLKVDDGEVRRAVLQELEQVRYFAQIDHPNLVSIEDRGEVDGIPYIVMAYAGSETLRDRLAVKDSDREELLRYFLQACRGVAALHERSLVHFDLKPANIFLKGGMARVGDYGLSKLVAHSRNSLSMGRGTPYYMAPEMLQRRGDHRSDVYSLGVMLYEVLTGDVPFKGDSEWEVLRKHEEEAPRFPPQVGQPYRGVVEKCLAKDPAQRFASVHEIISALGAPASTSAAAWQDVQDGVGAEPAPVPGAVPPPPTAGDLRAEYLKAARKAQASARQIALEAMQDARDAAGKAMRDAQAAMQDAVHRYQRRRERRRARRLQKEQEREARRQARHARHAPEGWPEIHRHKSRGGSWWWAVGLVVFFAFWLMWNVGGPARYQGPVTVIESSGSRAPQPPLVAVRAAEAARELQAQSQALAESMRAQAEQLRTEIAELQRRAAEQPLQAFAVEAVDPALLLRLQNFAATRPYDQAQARALIARGYPAVRAAVKALQQTAVTDALGLRRAQNLHRLLEEATGFDAIDLSEQADVARNAKAGALWGLFLQTVVPDPDTWQNYRRAFGR